MNRRNKIMADCKICKYKNHDCLMNLDRTCDNFKKEFKIIRFLKEWMFKRELEK